MINTESSRDGEITAKIDNVYIHSSYSPSKEAFKFYENNKLENYTTIVLIEPGLNYISDVIRKYRSSVKIISIYFEQLFYQNDSDKSDYSFHYTGNSAELSNFLTETLNELDLEGLKIAYWPASTRIYKNNTDRLKLFMAQHIRELHGNITTTSGFGKKYFRNFLKNYLYSSRYIIPDKTTVPIIIAGSGPGLKSDINFIKAQRNNFLLIALPSSLYFLRHSKIIPDFIISTDPGYYAARHLQGFDGIPLISPQTASIPNDKLKTEILYFNQNYFLEKYFPDFGIGLTIPQNGTVAGSAMYFSLMLTQGPVFMSGLDFSYFDLLSHNRPHTFDDWIEKATDRQRPLLTAFYDRNIKGSDRIKGRLRTNMALKTYSGWFAANSYKFNSRCFFIEGKTPPPEGFKALSHDKIKESLSMLKKNEYDNYINSSFDKRKNNLTEAIAAITSGLENLAIEISTIQKGSDIFARLNSEVIYNLFLPQLLEIKRHYIDKNGKEVQNKAVSLIKSTIDFINDSVNYV